MISTRTEKINDKIYCAYCGKLLKDSTLGIQLWPEQPVVCMCEQAEKEKELYRQLKEMYQLPLHSDLIDIKVTMYKNELLGLPSYVITTPV